MTEVTGSVSISPTSREPRRSLIEATVFPELDTSEWASRRMPMPDSRDHSVLRGPPLPPHRRSRVPIRLLIRGLVFCQRFRTSDGVEGRVPPLTGSNTVDLLVTAHTRIAGATKSIASGGT